MKIRKSCEYLDNDKKVFDFSRGIEIISSDSRILFRISEIENGIEIQGGSFCKHKGKLLNEAIIISPHASNVIHIHRPIYKIKKQKAKKQ